MAAAMPAAMPNSAQSAPPAADDAAAEWEALAHEEEGQDAPVVDSPSISAGWPAEGEGSQPSGDTDWPSAARQDAEDHAEVPITTHGQRLARLFRLPSLPRIPFMPSFGLPTACAAMGALILALMIWRADVVRLLPQTATFYKMVGLEVNLRGLAFKDIKVTNETVDGKPVLVIEGTIMARPKNRSNCRGCAFPSATRKARRSTPGTRCSSSRCSSPASAPTSSRGWLRRRPKAAILTYAFSTSGIWPATPEPGRRSAGARETTSCHAC
jgi:Protein of unknown function (DUF3426).